MKIILDTAVSNILYGIEKTLFELYLVSRGKVLELPFKANLNILFFCVCSALWLKQLLKC